MEYFKCLQKNVNVSSLLTEIEENEDAWFANTKRQELIPVQRETQTIIIRKPTDRDDIEALQNQETEYTDLAARFPLACKFMESVAKATDGTLSRATIVRLQPKGHVYLHVDHGAYYLIRKRYHLILKSEGSIMMSGGETVNMQEGELWWFDNSQHHQALNNSDQWRIHFIFDVLPNKYAALAKNPLTPDEVTARMKQAKTLKS